MARFLVVSLAVLSVWVCCANAVCLVNPAEGNWDKSFICPTEEPYPHDLIDMALEWDEEAFAFMQHAKVFYDQVADETTMGHNGWYCDDVCPQKFVNLTRVFHPNGQECHVVRPWEQKIQYVACGTKDCMIANNYAPNYYCKPDGFIKRKVLIYCPFMLPQCNYLTIKVPSACSCKSYFCNRRKTFAG